MNNEQQPKQEKVYRLIEGNMEAVAFVIWKNGMVIDEEFYKSLPNRLKKSFTDIIIPETINPSNMSEEIQNGAVETDTTEQVIEAVEEATTNPVEVTELNVETVETAETV
jgi:hydroxymethylpyrimidine/phosphomethylpyrimidine kinase